MAELISELVWQPLGAQEDADYTVDHFRTPDYNGGICVTLHGEPSHDAVACMDNVRTGNHLMLLLPA